MCDSLLDSAAHTRWITAPDWDTELKCDGDQVAVGACSGGGGWGHKDCPGDHNIINM